MKAIVRGALDAVSDGYSADRVVADPQLNERFISECRSRGLRESPAALNRALLNLRKSGNLLGRSPSRRTSFSREDEYRFASEMAVRFLERRDHLTLDEIICDPEIAREFDQLAAQLAPGFSPVEYRWAALNIRKARSLQPELLARVAPPISVHRLSVLDLQLSDIPAEQGLYLFVTKSEILYVGEAENLRLRLKKHLDHSDSKGLAQWIWSAGTSDLHIELQILDSQVTRRVRRALEVELIRSRQPIFNVKR